MVFKIFIDCILIYTAITGIFLSVDLYFWLVERFSRFHIGRWINETQWIERFYKVAVDWLPNTPTVQITDNTHLVLWDMLSGKYSRQSVQSWQTAGLLLGVCDFAKNNCEPIINKCVNHFFDHRGMWKKMPANVDQAMLAYSILKNYSDSEFIKPSMDFMIDLIDNHIAKDGMIRYSKTRINLRYVDTLGLVCPFLALYAKTYNKSQYAKLAYVQITKFNEFGLFKGTWLPAHAFEVVARLPMGVYGWGRGTGWYIISLIDIYFELEDSLDKDDLKYMTKQAAEYYLQFQREDGGFGVFLQDKGTYDSSATAIFAYFYASCYEIFKEENYQIAVQKCVVKLKSTTRRNGKLDYCQGDTKDVGIFSQRSDIMPFAQGMTLRAYSKHTKW